MNWKETKRFVVSEKKKRKNIVSQSHKIKRDNSTGKLKDMCGSQHMEKDPDIHPEERKYASDSLWQFP